MRTKRAKSMAAAAWRVTNLIGIRLHRHILINAVTEVCEKDMVERFAKGCNGEQREEGAGHLANEHDVVDFVLAPLIVAV